MSERSLIATSLLLLGADDTPLSKHGQTYLEYRRKVGASPVSQLLKRPSSESLCAAVHFCLWKADPKRAQTVFKLCYPPKAPAHNRDVKSQLSSWLQELEKDKKIPRKGCSSVSVLVSPTPVKALTLLGIVSKFALKAVAEREYGIVEDMSALPQAVQQQRIVALAQMFVADRKQFVQMASKVNSGVQALAKEYASLIEEKTALEHELHELAQEKEEGEDGSEDDDLSPNVIEIVGTMEPFWTEMESLQNDLEVILKKSSSFSEEKNKGSSHDDVGDRSLIDICLKRGLKPENVTDPSKEGVFVPSALTDAYKRVHDSLPVMTDGIVQRLGHAAMEWKVLAELKENKVKEVADAHAETTKTLSTLSQSVRDLENGLMPAEASAVVEFLAQKSEQNSLGVLLEPFDARNCLQQQNFDECIAAMTTATASTRSSPPPTYGPDPKKPRND